MCIGQVLACGSLRLVSGIILNFYPIHQGCICQSNLEPTDTVYIARYVACSRDSLFLLPRLNYQRVETPTEHLQGFLGGLNFIPDAFVANTLTAESSPQPTVLVYYFRILLGHRSPTSYLDNDISV